MPLCHKSTPLPQCLCGDTQVESSNTLIETVMVILMAIGLINVLRFLVNHVLDKVVAYIQCNFPNLSIPGISDTKCATPAPEPPSVSKCETKPSLTKPEPAQPPKCIPESETKTGTE